MTTLFDGTERSPKVEARSRRAVRLCVERLWPDWVAGHLLRDATGYVQADRRARELAEQGLLEKRRNGRFVEYRRKPA